MPEFATSDFNEEWYLARYPDVRDGVACGAFKTGREHYERYGRAEGREGCNPDDNSPLSYSPQPSLADALRAEFQRHNGDCYLAPGVLRETSALPRRILFVGACMLEAINFHRVNLDHVPGDFILSNQASESPEPPHPASDYDLQLSQIPLRTVMPEIGLWEIPYDDLAGHDRFLAECKYRLRSFVGSHLRVNAQTGLLTFVMNFFVPQQNPMGRLLPRYDVRNPSYFVSQLNEELESILSRYTNAYVLDCDLIAASMGRRHVQEDAVLHFSHGGMGPDFGENFSRIEPSPGAATYFAPRFSEAERAIWNEMIAMYRTVCQTDAVKMVVVDLDDTLWNGVATEMDYVGPEIAEGWPLGMIEALVYLKKRGVLLGLLSKNDEQRVSDVWDRVYGPRFPFSSFAAKIINWQAKSDNMRSLLRTVNLLARNVVYVDDHPAERAAMKAAFPEMRVLDGLHYYWRKTLLWAPETQSSHITEESVRRRETIQARADLEAASNGLTDREFQMFQRLRIQIERIAPEHGARQRAFELLNKTNQFNTTGRRWTVQEFSSFIGGEGTVYIVTAWDRFTPYGVVAVVLTEGPVIRQFVMSCRIFGRQVEIATLAQIIAQIKELGEVSADSHDTDANSPCRDLFRRMGFQWQDRWVLKGSATPVPDFIECRFVDANDGATTR